MAKRENYLTWDDYFMGLAVLSGKRSKDPNTQVGACIVGENNRINSVGYNGFPFGCSDDEFNWEREGEEINTKYPYVVHAELNAILNSKADLKNSRIYVSLFPCNECAKAIIQSGITKVYYLKNLYPDSIAVKASMKMFKSAGVQLIQLKTKEKSILLEF